LGNQSVLLAGVNDHPDTIKALCHALVKIRVRPYYLYQCDLVEGSGHFRTTIAAGLEIMEALRGHTSGYAVPTYVVDAPGGGGKIPVMPNYLISQSYDHVVLRNFEGYISSYAQPTDYQRPKPSRWTAAPTEEPGQHGVAGLLRGEHLAIRPEGWLETHERDEREGQQQANVDVSQEHIVENPMPAQGLPVAPPGDIPAWIKVN
jgi:lysine 2,3-aminomutase